LSATDWGIAVSPAFQFLTPRLPNGEEMQTTPTGAFNLSFVALK
jgi:hypothetical protein